MGEGEKIVAAEIIFEREHLSILYRLISLDNSDSCHGVCDMYRKMPLNGQVGAMRNPTCDFSHYMAKYT